MVRTAFAQLRNYRWVDRHPYNWYDIHTRRKIARQPRFSNGKVIVDAMESKRQAIAARLRAAREQAGLSQGQAAKVLGVHRPAITEMEAGRRIVSAEELAALADAYGVSVNWLVEAKRADPVRDRMELAARELGKLKAEDLDRLMQLLSTLKQTGGKGS